MNKKLKTKAIILQLVLGALVSAYVAGLHLISSWSNLLEELSGSVIGALILFLPFALLGMLARKLTVKGFYATAGVQFALVVLYFVYGYFFPDPLNALVYLVYIIPLQIISVIIALFVARKK